MDVGKDTLYNGCREIVVYTRDIMVDVLCRFSVTSSADQRHQPCPDLSESSCCSVSVEMDWMMTRLTPMWQSMLRSVSAHQVSDSRHSLALTRGADDFERCCRPI